MELTETEQLVCRAFRTGERIDVAGRPGPGRTVRAGVIRHLMLGGERAEPGARAGLDLRGALVTGPLEVDYADVDAPVALVDCEFDAPIVLFASRLRRLSLTGSRMPGLTASMATFDATLALGGIVASGPVGLLGTRIGGSLLLGGATLISGAAAGRPPGGTDVEPHVALLARALQVAVDVVAIDAEFRGAVRLDGATIGGRVTFHGARFTGVGGVALDGRHLSAQELEFRPAAPPPGAVDLRHARIGLLLDAPECWPRDVYLDGLTYEALRDAGDRLRWLARDPHGYRPQPYAQLARLFRAAGRDEEARAVQLAGERHRRAGLTGAARFWGHAQDLTVGYGFRPMRAAAWLAALLVAGTAVFGLHPPRAADPARAPDFSAPVYTLDLILPIVDLGQQGAYPPRGATAWLAYLLILAGLLFATTIGAAVARRLRRP
jgi:hypothetical protein